MSCQLIATEVSFAYERDKCVLNGVEATIQDGSVTGIVGPNGSGKSTFLRILAGLLHPDAGSVHLNDRALRSYSGRERARSIAFLPQSISPAFSLSVFEVVCLGRYPHSSAWGSLSAQDVAVASRALVQTQTDALRHRDFGSLSGGERQRVLLASILAQEPRLLLLDEPTSALDIHHQVEVMALLRHLCRDGYGIALVTHDLNLAARFCDRVVLLGATHCIVADGRPEDVLTGPLLSEAYGSTIRVGQHPFAPAPFVMATLPEGDGS